MKLRPLHDRVIVKRLEQETKTASGIVIPDNAAEKPDQGEVLAVGPGKKNDKGEIEEAGDMVIYVAGYPAIYGKQPLYFKDPVFQARASIPAPKATDRLRQVVEAGEGITI